jgi:hypothetical protein
MAVNKKRKCSLRRENIPSDKFPKPPLPSSLSQPIQLIRPFFAHLIKKKKKEPKFISA